MLEIPYPDSFFPTLIQVSLGTRDIKNPYSYSTQAGQSANFFILEIINHSDSRVARDNFENVKRSEKCSLKEHHVQKVISNSSIPYDFNVSGSRFLLSVETPGSPNKTENEYYIAHGYKYKEKLVMVHDTLTL